MLCLADRMMLMLLGPGQPAERWSPCWTLSTSSMMRLGMAEAVTGSVAPYASSACRPRWVLSSFKEYEAPHLAVTEPQWAVMWSCPWGTLAAVLWVIRAGRAKKFLLSSLQFLMAPCDFWGLSPRCGASHGRRGASSSDMVLDTKAFLWMLCSLMQAVVFPYAFCWTPFDVLALLPWGTQNTISWHALPWCSQQRLNKGKLGVFNTSLPHLWSLGEIWVTAHVPWAESYRMSADVADSSSRSDLAAQGTHLFALSWCLDHLWATLLLSLCHTMAGCLKCCILSI